MNYIGKNREIVVFKREKNGKIFTEKLDFMCIFLYIKQYSVLYLLLFYGILNNNLSITPQKVLERHLCETPDNRMVTLCLILKLIESY